ncbi:MAG: hypothetical protein K9L17_05415 [Clostridiales bacterium]|nr:hypothetical protein [Clostridiales bacterium]MCF8022109.1 hypothetical protein [Clostridiales bacterium]
MIRKLAKLGIVASVFVMITAITHFVFTNYVLLPEHAVSSAISKYIPEVKNEEVLINPGTIIRKEKVYVCGDKITIFQGPAPERMQGLTVEEVKELYSEKDGWNISKLSGNIVLLSKSMDKLCDKHLKYRHLGIYQGNLAVYKGPLGYDKDLIRVEKNISLNKLPQGLSEKLNLAINFDKHDYSTKLQLRKTLEFTSESDLNAVLDTLDEFN